ncbi:MAG TPA: helicase-related protein [Acetobacteraceae bacterium]|nr:helicase-related protein [Acetobacteraceae bacterium]
MSGFTPRVKAVLGPTNTGKTHLAMERLLGHHSGIIGFPLRLLARENYERMVAAKGERNVALITGEEKILPPGARYFACTVEAMPLDRQTEFVAVDEIQLCADPDRGHVFTDRLLHARGMVETMFLGAETIKKILKRLVPAAEIETRPRLSSLAYVGPAKLSRLPPRSAIVAFSAAEVYAIAEMIRSRRGGCAVVMGRLSPRTRNAQVALYQDKEVDFLVATDAIGMGLNMDVDHVAFAGLSKFDGHRPRPLTAPEIAQIAGRAGRGMRDGTFGETASCRALDEELVNAVESHAFEPLEQLCWRNEKLDFTSLDGLIDSLTSGPPMLGLVKGNDATDLVTLAALSIDPEIRRQADGRAAVRALWEACQIPDFRKLATDTHTKLCAKIFLHLRSEGVLPTDWVASQIAGLGRTDGDIDTLMARLADVRIWAYIAARADWTRRPDEFQASARQAEDLISDALHEKLMARFVDRRAAHLTRKLDASEDEELLSAVNARGVVLVEGHEVGRIVGLNFHADPAVSGAEKKLMLRAARRALRVEMPRRIARLIAAPDSALSLSAGQRVLWEQVEVARIRPGVSMLRPQIELLDSEFLDGPARDAVRERVQIYLDSMIKSALEALFSAVEAANSLAALRGLMHRLAEAGGVLAGEEKMPQDQREALKKIGVRGGRFALFVPHLMKPQAAAMRALLWAVWQRCPTPELPGPGLVSAPLPADWPAGFAGAMGWVQAGPVMIRLDAAERVAGDLAYQTRRGPVVMPTDLPSRLSVKRESLPATLNALGFRLIPTPALPDRFYGPPPPPMISLKRVDKPVQAPPPPPREPPNPDNPFAALAALRRA